MRLLRDVRRLPTTTRGRLTLAAAGILVVGLALADVGIYFALTLVQSQEADNQLRAQAERVASNLQVVEDRVTYARGGLPEETPDGVAVDLAVVGANGVLATTHNQPFSTATLDGFGRPALRGGQVISLGATTNGEAWRIYVTPLRPELGQDLVLVASTSLAEFQGSTTRAMVLVVVGSLFVFAAGVRLAYSLVGRALKPVQQIAQLAETLSERDLHRRVDVAAPDDELGELVNTFNRMLARLESSFNTLRGFTADASHELRSPLALMRTELEVSLGERVSTDEYRRVLNLMLAEVQHMAGVVEKLLLLARVDAGELRPQSEPIDVVDFLHEAYGRWLTRASEREIKLELSAPDSGTMKADLDLTRRIIDNLVENALRHSPTSGVVRLSATRGADGWCFEVADQGLGVPDEERERIFERFARADAARTPDAEGGTGLGLPLSAAFARIQDGEVRLAPPRSGWGAVFELWMPDSVSA